MKLASPISTLAFTSTVCAANEVEERAQASNIPSIDTVSVLAVLATAVPSSLLAEALTNPAAVSDMISSEFAAKETPAWYSALPQDVQSYLIPATTIDQAPSVFLSALPTIATILTIPHPTPHPTPDSSTNATRAIPTSSARYPGATGNSTLGVAGASGSRTGVLRTTGNPSSSATLSTATSAVSSSASASITSGTGNAASASPSRTASSTGGASIPTGLISAGLLGFVGAVGVFVL